MMAQRDEPGDAEVYRPETIAAAKTAILGFGNPVRGDDGIGVYVANKLQQQLGRREDVSVFDMGTSAFEILFRLKGHERIIIVDAVRDSGQPDGTLFYLPAAEIQAQIQDDPMLFLHGMKWDQALSYARKIMGGEFPEDAISVYLVAISAFAMGLEMSEALVAAGDRLIEKIMVEFSDDEPRI